MWARFTKAVEVFFSKSTPMHELRGALRPYSAFQRRLQVTPKKKFTPAILAVFSNAELPSNEYIRYTKDEFTEITGEATSTSIDADKKILKKGLVPFAASHPIKAVWHSLPPLFSHYSSADLMGGLIIAPFLNRLQIGIFTGLEFISRTAGAFLMWPAHKLSKAVDESTTMGDKSKRAAKIGIFIAGSAFWCAGIALTMLADACSFTKQLIDSTLHLVNFINPLWWIGKAIGKAMGDNSPTPSLKLAAKTFGLAVINLLPTAAIIVAGVLTGGLAIPVLKGLAIPLKAAGTAIVNSILAPATLAAQAFVGIYLGGAITIAVKLFSAIVKGCRDTLEGTNKPKRSVVHEHTEGLLDEERRAERRGPLSDIVARKGLGLPRSSAQYDSTMREDRGASNTTDSSRDPNAVAYTIGIRPPIATILAPQSS